MDVMWGEGLFGETARGEGLFGETARRCEVAPRRLTPFLVQQGKPLDREMRCHWKSQCPNLETKHDFGKSCGAPLAEQDGSVTADGPKPPSPPPPTAATASIRHHQSF
jgi:hypothetical protein